MPHIATAWKACTEEHNDDDTLAEGRVWNVAMASLVHSWMEIPKLLRLVLSSYLGPSCIRDRPSCIRDSPSPPAYVIDLPYIQMEGPLLGDTQASETSFGLRAHSYLQDEASETSFGLRAHSYLQDEASETSFGLRAHSYLQDEASETSLV